MSQEIATTLSAVERKHGARLHIDAETSKQIFNQISIDGETLNVSEVRASDAQRRRTGPVPKSWIGVSSIRAKGQLDGNLLVLKSSKWKYKVLDDETKKMVEKDKWEPPTPEEEERLRQEAVADQPETGFVPLEEAPSTTTKAKTNKKVHAAVMNRTKIAPANCCERCFDPAREYHDDGTPILIHHHMFGRKVSDRIETSARICSVCHDPISFKTTNGLEYNRILIERVRDAEAIAGLTEAA